MLLHMYTLIFQKLLYELNGILANLLNSNIT